MGFSRFFLDHRIALLNLTQIYWVLMGFTGFYRNSSGLQVFLLNRPLSTKTAIQLKIYRYFLKIRSKVFYRHSCYSISVQMAVVATETLLAAP